MKILTQHRDKLDTLATALDREEELDESEIEALIGPPAYERKRDKDADASKPSESETVESTAAQTASEETSESDG